ncbi:MarR family winged helix-turn-helix transcriptional regulator [Pseudomonas sp. TH31]|uniref:MarR family winged helix-turn-helix transcriptional regulator n=1 Tax=Pseudomonas sp. TH31 TaxID=2796396 RepID=UPI0019139D3C|nr:MarR family transcriptional regulator [Pseudomonas sp. TH31]MBK5417892.1 MarR family transcriptional regulator [Pseudomonas sp. TH31]
METPEKKTAIQTVHERETLVLALGEQLSALLSASRALTVATSAEFHPDLPPAAFHIAHWLHVFGPAKVSCVAEAVAMDRSATSRLTARLIDLELVEARPDPLDGRGTILSLSRRGRKKIRQAILHKGDVFRQRIDDWSDVDLEQLTQLLRRFNGLPP